MVLAPAENPLINCGAMPWELTDNYDWSQHGHIHLQDINEPWGDENDPDPTKTKNLRREYERKMLALWDRALRDILAALPASLTLSQAVQLQTVQTTLDNFDTIIELEIENNNGQLIIRYTTTAYKRGRKQTTEKLISQQVLPASAEGSGFVSELLPGPDAAAMRALNELSFDLVKGATDTLKTQLARIIRSNALGEYDRDQTRQEIIKIFNINKTRIRSIVHTETVRAYNAAVISRISDVTDHYDWILGRGPCPSQVCPDAAAGAPYRIRDVNAPRPPLHPNCNCSIAAYFPGASR